MNRSLLIIIGLCFAGLSADWIMHIRSHNYSTPAKPYYETGCDGKCTIAIRETKIIDSRDLITTYKEWLKSDNEKTRAAAESELKRLGVPKMEIEEAKADIIDFTGKVTSVSMHNRGPHSLADWLIRIDVRDVNTSDQKIQPGKEFAYWVHSPVQFFHEPGEDAVGKTYKFRVFRSLNEKGEKYPGLKVMDEILKLCLLLRDKDPSVRRKALIALSYAEWDRESATEIRKLLNDDSDGVRGEATRVLSRFRDKESIPAIRKLLNDDSAEMRRAAVCALGFLDDKESIPAIRKLLNDNSDKIRGDAACALVFLGDKESIPEIKKLLNDESEQVRKDAAKALELFDKLEIHIQKTKEGK
jgi:hypothetical protein